MGFDGVYCVVTVHLIQYKTTGTSSIKIKLFMPQKSKSTETIEKANPHYNL